MRWRLLQFCGLWYLFREAGQRTQLGTSSGQSPGAGPPAPRAKARQSIAKSFQKGKVSDEASQAGRNSQKRNCIVNERASPAEAALRRSPGPSYHCLQLSKFSSFWIFEQFKEDTFINSFINDSISNSLAFEHQAVYSTGRRLRISPEP